MQPYSGARVSQPGHCLSIARAPTISDAMHAHMRGAARRELHVIAKFIRFVASGTHAYVRTHDAGAADGTCITKSSRASDGELRTAQVGTDVFRDGSRNRRLYGVAAAGARG